MASSNLEDPHTHRLVCAACARAATQAKQTSPEKLPAPQPGQALTRVSIGGTVAAAQRLENPAC